jgi:hypothetical protein
VIVDPIVFLKLHAHPVVKLLEEVPILGTTADRTTGVVGENAPHAVASLPEEQRGDRTWTTPKAGIDGGCGHGWVRQKLVISLFWIHVPPEAKAGTVVSFASLATGAISGVVYISVEAAVAFDVVPIGMSESLRPAGAIPEKPPKAGPSLACAFFVRFLFPPANAAKKYGDVDVRLQNKASQDECL